MSPTRRHAVNKLIRIEGTGAYVGLMGPAAEERGLDPREERQVTEYVAGITRWRRWLDFVLDQYYRGSIARMETALRQILRVGAYDLLVLNTPPHAAVNEAVSLAKEMVRPDAGRLANAVLRQLERHRDALPEPSGSVAHRLAVQHSHPTWLVERWLARMGVAETTDLLEANNARPTYGVRVNTLKVSVDDFVSALDMAGVPHEPSRYLPYFVRVAQLHILLEAGLIDSGECAIQDEGAGLVVRVLDPQPGERIIDLCAAPGGKSLHAAQMMENRGEILAVDVNAGRLRLVERAAAVQGVDIVRLLVADAREIDPLGIELPDRVLLDAPCTGLGVLAKRADLRWNRRREDLKDLVVLQDRLLDAAADLVRPGGVLVYGTCTIEPDENEARVEAFLSRHADFELESASALVPPEVCTPGGYLQTLPHVHSIDGAFAARLRRQASSRS